MLDYSSFSSVLRTFSVDKARQIRTVKTICQLVGKDELFLKDLLYRNNYKTYKISKRTGGFRVINAPNEPLKQIQEILAEHLLIFYRSWMMGLKSIESTWGEIKPPYGGYTLNFEEGKSPILTNAEVHLGKKYLLKLDIKDFYSSLCTEDIVHMFQWKLGTDPEAAYLLTLLCTFKDEMPTGAPTSSVVSELIMHDFDYLVSLWLKQRDGWTYSRYADDICISSDYPLDVSFITFFIGQQLEEYGLSLNEKKTKYFGPHQAKYVTGVKVNEKPNVNRRYIRNLRAILHDWEKNGSFSASERYVDQFSKFNYSSYEGRENLFKESVKGKINWVGQVRGMSDGVYLGLKKKYTKMISV